MLKLTIISFRYIYHRQSSPLPLSATVSEPDDFLLCSHSPLNQDIRVFEFTRFLESSFSKELGNLLDSIQLKASSCCSSLLNQYQCFSRIFSQTKTRGKWLSKLLVDPLYLR
uniref:Uncharacterized protein n=1 Tax=Salix viminalis TaxID=40686 RepID=A0A6N2KNH5_SALVM